MRKITAIIALLLLMSPLSFSQRGKENTSRFIPEDGYTLLFAGQNNKSNDDYVKITRKVPAGFMFYTALSDLQGLDDIADFGAGETSGKYLNKKYPKAALQIGLYLVNSLDNVIDGSFDENIERLAIWIKNVQVPVFLRIGYEFDFPDNDYDPEKYKKAFRYIVDKFDGLKVKNAAYVWHSYASLNPRGIEAWYPGDEYVDWCAISYFAHPQWIPMVKFANKHSKPLMIAECAPVLGHDLKEFDKEKWYERLFRFIEAHNVKALCYINTDWNELPMFASYAWGNSRVDASKNIKNIWEKKTSDKKFIGIDELYNKIELPKKEKVLILFAHPDNKKSSNAQILNKVKSILDEKSLQYKIKDLYADNFDPVLSKTDCELIKEQKKPLNIEQEVKLIKDADTVIFIFPVWWNNMPAILKGYIDKVFSLGFACNFQQKNGTAFLEYKKAIIFNTLGSPYEVFKDNYESSFKKVFDEGVLGLCGFKVLNHTFFGNLPNTEDKNLTINEEYIKRIEEVLNYYE